MAGPSKQTAVEFIIPAGEAQVLFEPTLLANKIQNFELTAERTLKSVVGPTYYEPKRISGSSPSPFEEPHGIFHAGLLGGIADTLIVRADNYLYRHQGWERGFSKLTLPSSISSLVSETRPLYPDHFVVLNDKIVWTNGIDRALVINHDGMVVPLGFAAVPGAPTVDGPQQPDAENRRYLYPNALGYSWGGEIGTIGDLLDGQTGAVLAGAWEYYIQWEDIFGNLSQPSAASNLVNISTIQADPLILTDGNETGSEVTDLTRQFLVHLKAKAPEHAVAQRIYRTPDLKNQGGVPQLVTRLPGNSQVFFSDRKADGYLGSPISATVAVPVFRTMCTHQGCLVIANTPEDPGIVRQSEPGFPGTFSAASFIYPDSGGAEVTAVASHNGELIAFTRNTTYLLKDFAFPVPLAQGIGCVAPRSIQALPDGTLIWLAHDGFYGMNSGVVSQLSKSIQRTMRHYVSRSRACMAVAAMNHETGEYYCALTPAGENKNTLVLTFDGQGWKRQTLGLHLADMCLTDDWRRMLLAVATDTDTDDDWNDVFVLNRETVAYAARERDILYRSAWLRGDDTGLKLLNVRTMYIGLLDSYDDDFEILFYRNGSYKAVVQMTDVKAVGPDDDSGLVTDIAGSAVIGTATTHNPRLFYRQVPVGLQNVNSWAFEIRAKSPVRLHLAAFAFDVSIASSGNALSRIPRRGDT